jgi:hypothetical protein
MIKRRRRLRQTTSLKDRLTAWAKEIREQANQLSPGPERDRLLKKASQADTASQLDEWVDSPGLQIFSGKKEFHHAPHALLGISWLVHSSNRRVAAHSCRGKRPP